VTARALPPRDIAPREFFETWVPEAVRSDAGRRTRIADLVAGIQFELAGPDGGDFHLRLDRGEVHGGVGPLDAPDLVLRTSVDTWRRLNAGEIAAPTALLTGQLRFHGSLYLALRLHFILG
jgi:putative sterol carrier protein